MSLAWPDRLERRVGFLALPGLAAFLVGMNAAVGLLSLARPDFPARLVLDPALLREGQAWRAVTFAFVPPELGLLWLMLWLIVFYGFLQLLEDAWGDFKLTLYCLVGVLAHGAVALAGGHWLTNAWFNASLFLAFGRLYPELEVRLFFVLPVKMKWLSWAAWAGAALDLALSGGRSGPALAAGLVNYGLFFGPDHWHDLRRLTRL